MMTLLTPSQCQIEVDPLSGISSKHFHQKDVNKNSFTECPGEGSQEEVVQQGCHNLAGILVKRRMCKTDNKIINMLLFQPNKGPQLVRSVVHFIACFNSCACIC